MSVRFLRGLGILTLDESDEDDDEEHDAQDHHQDRVQLNGSVDRTGCHPDAPRCERDAEGAKSHKLALLPLEEDVDGAWHHPREQEPRLQVLMRRRLVQSRRPHAEREDLQRLLVLFTEQPTGDEQEDEPRDTGDYDPHSQEIAPVHGGVPVPLQPAAQVIGTVGSRRPVSTLDSHGGQVVLTAPRERSSSEDQREGEHDASDDHLNLVHDGPSTFSP